MEESPVVWNVEWKPLTNSERSAQMKYAEWITHGVHMVLSSGRNKGHDCVAIWPVNDGNSMRWIRSSQITKME